MIPDTFYWQTIIAHFDNNETMAEYLTTYLPDNFKITQEEGTYAEIINEEGIRYGVHASGNGDSFNHKIEFELLEAKK